MKHPEALQSTRATVSAVLWFAPVREMGIWIDFDFLPQIQAQSFEKETQKLRQFSYLKIHVSHHFFN